MLKVPLIQLGVGQIGSVLIKQIIKSNDIIQKRSKIKLFYFALLDSEGLITRENGLDNKQLKQILKLKEEGKSIAKLEQGTKWGSSAVQATKLNSIFSFPNALIVDLTDSVETTPFLIKGAEKGYGLVLANKIPLSSSYRDFEKLTKGSIKYETTVGAGLPVVDTLNKLLDSGDEVIEIKGALSGTLNFIFSQIDSGESFSSAVKKAYELGYTEPDPRVDLSGRDLARKALILARTLGYELAMDDVSIESLYSKEMDGLEVEEFLRELPELDDSFKERYEISSDKTSRYLVTVKKGNVRTGIENLAEDSLFITLRGPENLVSYKTKRYNEFPLYIRGPGAGPEVTAAGVLADIITLSKQLR